MRRQYLLGSVILLSMNGIAFSDNDYPRALKRAQYLLNGSIPTDTEIDKHADNSTKFRNRVRDFLEDEDSFYKSLLRYHEKYFGTGLKVTYIDELKTPEVVNNEDKFSRITCSRNTNDKRLRCFWSSDSEGGGNSPNGDCPVAAEEAASVFWYPGIVAWACPSVLRSCGHDLSRCFIQYPDRNAAKNSEMGATEIFDSRFSVIKSLSKQSAGIASRIASENFPYKLILKSGLSAVDSAVIHFYRLDHHFRIEDLRIPNEAMDILKRVSLTDSKYALLNTSTTYESGGALSTFGYLRRFDKNRTRGNELYERFLCRKFTSELPRVFPQDPGNLRETEGCSGCHATLDPLADFFLNWGEGGELYRHQDETVDTYFAGKDGRYLEDLANIVANDTAFATCTTMRVWEWLMGRQFYFEEAELRGALADYFIHTKYSLRELIYAVATHPAFMARARGDGAVGDPLQEPPLGTVPNDVSRTCSGSESYSAVADYSSEYCESCHDGTGGRSDLSSQSAWEQWGAQAVSMMGSGQMPPGQSGPEITDFKETVRCWLGLP